MKPQKKWSILATLSLSLMLFIAGCTSKETLYLYTWADNFDEEVLEEFEEKFNVRVKYDVMSNNEELLAKIRTGGSGYDLIQPSDYMVETMIKLDLLQELDQGNIPNLQNMSAQFRNLPYDPDNKYSVVYTWGVTGIAYNKKFVTDPVDSWADLWDPKYAGKVVLLDDSREVIGMGLKKLGFSNSTQDQAQLESAVGELKLLLPNILAFDTDNIKQKFISEEVWIGTVWSGDASLIVEENADMGFVIPEEGSTIWADNYAIPRGAKHKDLAEKFINFMLNPEISVRNYESIGYGDPNEKAIPLHSEEYLSNNTIFLSDDEMSRTEWLGDVGEALQQYDQFWTELKSGRNSF